MYTCLFQQFNFFCSAFTFSRPLAICNGRRISSPYAIQSCTEWSIYSPNQSTGFCKTSTIFDSLEFDSTSWQYSHLLVRGGDIRILSILPLVVKPNFVPLSYTKLNSTYLPLRICCQFLLPSVKSILILLSKIGKYDCKKLSPHSFTNLKQSFFELLRKSSKNIPPTPLLSFRCLMKK